MTKGCQLSICIMYINLSRHLAGIYEVLKDKETRAMYDKVLVEGLPDWRMPAYYFRRMRKIGLAEGLLYLLGRYFIYIVTE